MYQEESQDPHPYAFASCWIHVPLENKIQMHPNQLVNLLSRIAFPLVLLV